MIHGIEEQQNQIQNNIDRAKHFAKKKFLSTSICFAMEKLFYRMFTFLSHGSNRIWRQFCWNKKAAKI